MVIELGNNLLDEPIKISRKEFDELARNKQFILGPWIQDWDREYGAPYVPKSNRKVWGQLIDGRNVWATE
jgi:hypothetical protein